MMLAFFRLETEAEKARQALPATVPTSDPAMAVEPFQGRPWVIQVSVDPGDTREFQIALQAINRFGGVFHQGEPLTTRPGGAPFMNSMPQSVIDRYEAEHPEQAEREHETPS